MPTFGWVREDALDAFLAATEPPLPKRTALLPSFRCPFCTNVLDSDRLLQKHLSSSHSIARPILLIQGREPEAEIVVRGRYTDGDYTIVNTTDVVLKIDGTKQADVSVLELIKKLENLSDATAVVELRNCKEEKGSPVVTSYRISYRVAESSSLIGIEDAFFGKMLSNPLTISLIGEFLADGRCSGVGHDYSEGIANYLMGLLVKEQTTGQSITSPVARYRELFGAAIAQLSPHNRRLPQLLCSVMRFAINDLSNELQETGFLDLDLAARMIRGQGEEITINRQTGMSRRALCPIDHGTSKVINLAARLSQEERWGPILNEDCRHNADGEIIDAMDRQKILVIWAITALRLRAQADAIEPLSQLSATYPFSNWATTCLEAINK